MTWRAHVQPDFAMQGVAVHLGQRHGEPGGPIAANVLPVALTLETTDPGATAGPFLRLPDDAARALFDALAEHYGTTSSGQQQRADYEHERRRTDKVIDALIEVATATPITEYREVGR